MLILRRRPPKVHSEPGKSLMMSVGLCACVHLQHSHSFTRLCLVRSISVCRHRPVDGCCEIQKGPAIFDTLVFWGNSQPGAVDQEDLVMTRKSEEAEVPGCQ